MGKEFSYYNKTLTYIQAARLGNFLAHNPSFKSYNDDHWIFESRYTRIHSQLQLALSSEL